MELSQFADIDDKLARLAKARETWASGLSLSDKLALLQRVRALLGQHANEWVALALKHRRIPDDTNHELHIEEKAAETLQVYIVARFIRLLIEMLEPAAKTQQRQQTPNSPQQQQQQAPIMLPKPSQIWHRRGADDQGNYVVRVFPWGRKEATMFSGITAETWIQPGKEPTQGHTLRISQQQQRSTSPSSSASQSLLENEEGSASQSAAGSRAVSLVLGAGNVNSIVFTDTLSKLFCENKVLIVKQHPVNSYIHQVFLKILAPLIERDFVHSIQGDVAEGKHLTYHPLISDVHITGSELTHNRIVWGDDNQEVESRKSNSNPKLQVPISSELGCVTPWIIVPTAWSSTDLDYKARDIAGAVMQNVSFNCVAPKLLVVSKHWPHRKELLDRIRSVFSSRPARYAYYPGARARYNAFLDRYRDKATMHALEGSILDENHLKWMLITDVEPKPDEYALKNEAFAPVLVEVVLDEADPVKFLRDAVRLCNEEVWGNLSCTLLAHPNFIASSSDELEQAIADLKYGTIGLNIWSSAGYALASTVWGGYHTNTVDNVCSGVGFVHNVWMLDHPAKSVVRAPFRMPMNIKLSWFPDLKNPIGSARAMLDFELSTSTWNVLRSVVGAFRN